MHNGHGRRRVIDLALVSDGRHVNYIFYFLSLPGSMSPTGQPAALSSPANPTLLHTLSGPGGNWNAQLTTSLFCSGLLGRVTPQQLRSSFLSGNQRAPNSALIP